MRGMNDMGRLNPLIVLMVVLMANCVSVTSHRPIYTRLTSMCY